MNPAAIRREERQEMSLDEFFEVYYRDHMEFKTKGPERRRREYNLYLSKSLGRTKLSDIKRDDCLAIMHQHANKGHFRTANIIQGLLRAILNKALVWEYLAGSNSAAHIPRYPEYSRDRFLHGEELQRFVAALRLEPDETHRDCIFVLLLTGIRKTNVLTMCWHDIDFESAIWRIPDTKNNAPHIVNLAQPVMSILKTRYDSETRHPDFVFPGRGANGHLQGIKRAWQRLLDSAGIEDLWVHDLRRTFASAMLDDGNDPVMIGKALGHKDIQATLVYARRHLDQLRAPVESVVKKILHICDRELKAVK